MAATQEIEDDHADQVRTQLRHQMLDWLKKGVIDPHCAICGASRATWRYDLRRTMWATMEEAMPHLRQTEAENIAANALWGDLHRTTRPN